MAELSKNNYGAINSNTNIMMIILKKIISNEKLIVPRLPIFEKIAPSINVNKCEYSQFKYEMFNEKYLIKCIILDLNEYVNYSINWDAIMKKIIILL